MVAFLLEIESLRVEPNVCVANSYCRFNLVLIDINFLDIGLEFKFYRLTYFLEIGSPLKCATVP